MKPTGESDEKTDGSPKIPAQFDFSFFFILFSVSVTMLSLLKATK